MVIPLPLVLTLAEASRESMNEAFVGASGPRNSPLIGASMALDLFIMLVFPLAGPPASTTYKLGCSLSISVSVHTRRSRTDANMLIPVHSRNESGLLREEVESIKDSIQSDI